MTQNQINEGSSESWENKMEDAKGAFNKVIHNQCDDGGAEINVKHIGDAGGAVGKALKDSATDNQHKATSSRVLLASSTSEDKSQQQRVIRGAEFCIKKPGDSRGAVQKMTHQNRDGYAGLRSVEETEHSGEDGTGGQKEVNIVGDKERINVTLVAFSNQEKEQALSEPKAIQHSISSPV